MVDSYEKFKHSSLPEKKYFSLSLRDGKRNRNYGHISDERYQHLQNVWDIFNLNTFEDFHDHYLKKDLLLLAAIFENFISTNLKYYGLDPCHYFSAPGLSLDAMLKMTKVKLEKINDPDKCMFFELGMSGGVNILTKNKNILYFDMNNLYRHVYMLNIYHMLILNGSKT